MASSLTQKFKNQPTREVTDSARVCVWEEARRDRTRDEKFPLFTRNLFFSAFPVPENVVDRRVGDDNEADPALYMIFERHLGSGRLGKSYVAERVNFAPYASTTVHKPDPKMVVIVTKMDTRKVDYVDAVRSMEPFTIFSNEHLPFFSKILLSFRTSLPDLTDHYYFINEYWSTAVSLCHRLQKVGRMNEDDAKFYVSETIEAIAFVHKHKKILRRLSLCNILIDPTGHVKLVPYMMCEQNLDCGQACNMLVKNCGDQFYASPEVVFGVDVQYSADWWSLGVILYQLLTGEMPFTGRTLGDLGKAITECPLCPSDYVTAEAAAFLKQILFKDPRRRLGFSEFDALGSPGVDQIREHPFFLGQSWHDVREQLLMPPYIPQRIPPTSEEVFREKMKGAANKEQPTNQTSKPRPVTKAPAKF